MFRVSPSSNRAKSSSRLAPPSSERTSVASILTAFVWSTAAFWFFASAFAANVDAGSANIAGLTASDEPSIRIENCADGEILSYSVALLRGSAPGVSCGTVVVENLSSPSPDRISRATVRNGRFKVLVELTPGPNRLSIGVGVARIDFELIFRPSANPNFVRLIYFVDSTGNESFETPEFWRDASETLDEANAVPQTVAEKDFRSKFQIAALLWQTATAERLNDAGYGRRTFALELDDSNRPVVCVLRGEKTAAEYAALTERQRFNAIYDEVSKSTFASPRARCFVLLAFARRDPTTGETSNRLALGGGFVASLDASILFAWPNSLNEVAERFADGRPIPETFAVDSAYRRTRWAFTASTLGAGLHELGHSFGLDHSTAPNDAMSRGFDRFNRIFTVVEPPCATSATETLFPDDSATTWEKASAERLIRSRWIDK